MHTETVLQLCAVDFTAYHLLRPLGMALRDAGYRVTFCCSPGEGLEKLAAEGFDVVPIPIHRSYNILRHIISFVRLYRLLRRRRFEIVHAHTPVAGLIGRVAAKLAGVPRIVYTAHGFYFHEGMHGIVRCFFLALERFGARLSDLIFVQSREDWKEALRERIATEDKMIHIGNGVDPALFEPQRYVEEAEKLRAELGVDYGPVIGFVGRIVREKGAVEFVRAAASVKATFPGSKFVLVGSPLASDRDGCWVEVNRLRDELGISSDMVLTGYRTDVPAILTVFDIFVLPSYREGMPRALLEAMAAGLPVVASDIRGCREEVEDGVTGYLVPPRRHEPLARAIERLLSSGDRGQSMGRAGKRRVKEHFNEYNVLEKQVHGINTLIKG
ncbi:MAG: glycosyltransferase family 4 protein [bacterium]|nr:MAG: glycosyltransferase family 4 protein [bacterium]